MSTAKRGGMRVKVAGKWASISWPELAKLTATVLEEMPTEPDYYMTDSALFLGPREYVPIDLQIHGEPLIAPVLPANTLHALSHPKLAQSLESLRFIYAVIDAHCRRSAGMSSIGPAKTFEEFHSHLDRLEQELAAEDIKAAFKALGQIEVIHSRRYVPAEFLKSLPINVAEVARTESTANRLKSKPGKRRPEVDRRGPMTKAIEGVVKQREGEDHSAISVFRELKSADVNRFGIDVIELTDDDKVMYYVGDQLKSMTWTRFSALVSEAATAKQRRLLKRR